MMELRHYHSEHFELDRTRTYEQPPLSVYGKPRGLWVSVLGEDDWPSWCTSEDFYPEGITHEHRVTIKNTARIAGIGSAEQLVEFTQHYGEDCPDFRYRSIINWQRVAAEFDGIVIAPYQWSQRMDLDWYYPWDCASGCIWNLDAIESFEAVPVNVS